MHWRFWFGAGANAQLEKRIEFFPSHREITDSQLAASEAEMVEAFDDAETSESASIEP